MAKSEESVFSGFLKVYHGEKLARTYPLTKALTLGSHRDNDICIEVPDVMPFEARVEPTEEGARFIRLNSEEPVSPENTSAIIETFPLEYGMDLGPFGGVKVIYFTSQEKGYRVVDLGKYELTASFLQELLDEDTLAFLLPTSHEIIENAVEFGERFIEKLNLSKSDLAGLVMAFREALSNAARHGNKDDYSKQIRIFFSRSSDKFEFRVSDEGEGFDLKETLKKTDEEGAVSAARERYKSGGIGGLGLRVLQKCVDEVSQNEEGNEISLVKHISPSPDEPAEPAAEKGGETPKRGEEADEEEAPQRPSAEEAKKIITSVWKKVTEEVEQDLQSQGQGESQAQEQRALADTQDRLQDQSFSEVNREEGLADRTPVTTEREDSLLTPGTSESTTPSNAASIQPSPPLQAGPAGSVATPPAPPEPSSISRKVAVRYYHRMNPLRNFPLLVVLSKETLAAIKHSKVTQVEGKEKVVVKREAPVVEVVPIFPGCLVMPPRIKVDVTPEEAKAKFWLTPNTEGELEEARVEIWYQDKLATTIETPAKATKHTWAILSMVFALLVPVISALLEILQVDVRKNIPLVLLWMKRGVEALGGATTAGLLLALLGVVGAVVFYLLNRPEEAEPIESIFSGR